LKEGLVLFSRFLQYLVRDVDIELIENKNDLTINVKFLSLYESARADLSLSVLYKMLKINYQEPFNLKKVTLIHSKPDSEKDYVSYFGCKVEFDQQVDSITLPLKISEEELPSGNLQLASISDQILHQYIKNLTNDDLKIRLKI